jgi:hypothetical protein
MTQGQTPLPTSPETSEVSGDAPSDTYWQSEFAITDADLDRLERFIEEQRAAQPLETLVKRVIRGRLRYGADTASVASGSRAVLRDRQARLWDPAAAWHAGEHAILWTYSYARQRNEVKIGVMVGQDQEAVLFEVDDTRDTRRIMQRARSDSRSAQTWRQTVENAVEQLRRAPEGIGRVDLIVLEHGSRVASHLLGALKADGRFVESVGRWFLRRLTVAPPGEQVAALAWAMLERETPEVWETSEVCRECGIEDDAGRFGLHLAMAGQPGRFGNIGTPERPRWHLAGPPPGEVTARHAAYDPETYHVLSEPGERLDRAVSARLWELGLLRAVCLDIAGRAQSVR